MRFFSSLFLNTYSLKLNKLFSLKTSNPANFLSDNFSPNNFYYRKFFDPRTFQLANLFFANYPHVFLLQQIFCSVNPSPRKFSALDSKIQFFRPKIIFIAIFPFYEFFSLRIFHPEIILIAIFSSNEFFLQWLLSSRILNPRNHNS